MKPFYSQGAARAHYYAVRTWMLSSILLFIATLCLMSFLFIPEYLMQNELRAAHKELQSYARGTSVSSDASKIQMALTKIENRQKKAGQPVALLKKIKNLCKEDSSLESLSLKRHDLQITLAAKNAPALVSIADSLAQQPSCTGLHISSLEPKEQRMIAILKKHQETKSS